MKYINSLLSHKFLQICIAITILFNRQGRCQTNQPSANGITTYVNPILPGDHPDQTLMRIGKDFYSTGSNFHFTPYLPILHSTDLMHWEVIARVIPPTSNIPNNDTPSGGTWQGALAYFNNKYWVYFSNNAGGGQYFCNATNMKGPWSTPVKVNTSTGVYGYDNSIFVDDDGTPWMLLKNGQDNNGLQKLGMDGQPVGQALNLNWINAADANGNRPYSWAEGPVMCKRNGRYYYFVAGNVTGGQYVLSTTALTADQSKWTRHGNFWQTATSSGGFTGPNHITQPIMLDDGTWWCLSHAYDNGGWEGQGRQSHLHQVVWDANGVPRGVPVNTNPVAGPNLASNGIIYDFVKSDYFTSSVLSLNWHFLSKVNAATSKYSLSDRPGYLRLKPGSGNTHLLQKDKGKYYSLTTKVDLNATANGQQAGIRMTSGNDDVTFTLYSGYNNGKKIGMAFAGTSTEVNNNIGNTVWLRVERAAHILTGYFSADGQTWTQIGTRDVSNLDKSQPEYNKWVGTSVGLYAAATSADFDHFIHRYGFSPIRVEGRNNWFGTTFSTKTPGRTITNSTTGDWLMLAGVDMGDGDQTTGGIEVNLASANNTSSLEVWLDNIGGNGKKVATIAVPNTGGTDTWKNVLASFAASGQHDVYLRFVGGANAFFVNTFRFAKNAGPLVSFASPSASETFSEGSTIALAATATTSNGTISNVKFYDGTTLLYTDNSAPFSYDWKTATAGTHTLKAVATDNSGNTAETTVTIKVNVAQGPYNGTAHPIPGTIQFEEFDLGGNGFAYYDDSPGSAVTPIINYRTDEDVDIEACTDTGGGYNLGYTSAGEWLEYTVDVKTAGAYDLDLRVACNGDGRKLSLAMDEVNIVSDVAIPNTAGWQTWVTVTLKNISLKAGKQIMRLTIGNTNYVNLNYITFKAVVVAAPPKVSITSPLNNSNYTALEKVIISAEATDEDGNIAEVKFYDGSTLLGSDKSAPYSFEWSGMSMGTHTITAIATDNSGLSTTSAPVTISIKGIKAAYATHIIPGRIEAEAYDLGGEGVSYHEANANGNEGGADFRNDEVDIEKTQDVEGEYNIGYVLQGEWLEYMVEVIASGNYDLDVRVAADGDGKVFHIEMDGKDVTGPIQIPGTGGWQSWKTVTLSDIKLTAGQHVMRIAFDASYLNLNYIEFRDVITNIDHKYASEMEVFPNPFNDDGFTIRQEGNFHYKVTDISGIEIESGKGVEKKVIGGNLNSGIYFLKVENNNNVFIHKVIKQ